MKILDTYQFLFASVGPLWGCSLDCIVLTLSWCPGVLDLSWPWVGVLMWSGPCVTCVVMCDEGVNRDALDTGWCVATPGLRRFVTGLGVLPGRDDPKWRLPPDWVSEWLRDWLSGVLLLMEDWFNDWFNDWFGDWLNDWLREWLRDCCDILRLCELRVLLLPWLLFKSPPPCNENGNIKH